MSTDVPTDEPEERDYDAEREYEEARADWLLSFDND
jgi:hypothetical protein